MEQISWGVQLTDEDADGIYIGTICDLSDGDGDMYIQLLVILIVGLVKAK